MMMRKSQKINHGRKNKQKQKICHGLTRNYTEISRSRKLAKEIGPRRRISIATD